MKFIAEQLWSNLGQTFAALMEDLVVALRKEEKLLDADAWKYAAPRSRRSDIS